MRLASTFADVRDAARGSVGLVPTMGYLHEGHASLLDAARRECDYVVMSLFVNPLQFDESRDLSRYPRDLDRDVAIAEAAGVDIVLAPSLDEMYAAWPPATVVTLPTLSTVLEGAHRPGHFDGVATVVAKLFAGVQPDMAYFGRKDAQQVAVVTAMARDLSFPLEIRGMPTVREADGLALSSRNVFLSADDRIAALKLSRGLMAAADAIDAGERAGQVLVRRVRDAVAAAPLSLEYVELARHGTLEPVARLDEPCFLSLAARVGAVRLIDNIHIDMFDDAFVPDRGTWLEEPSMLYAAGGGR
jgi:pantoate--beta-alanine ligase